MTEGEAIAFLRTVQPMPDDQCLSEELIEKYDEVRNFLIKHPSNEGVRLMLHSFGSGDGWGVYQLVEDAVAAVDPDQVVVYLLEAMQSPIQSVRYWSTQISQAYEHPSLVEVLRNLLRDPSEGIRLFALVSIEKYIDETLLSELRTLATEDGISTERTLVNEILYRDSPQNAQNDTPES